MSTAQNKQLLQHLYAELAKGNARPWIESMADNVRWTVSGSTAWSRTYEGKQAVLDELLRPLNQQFAQPYKTIADRFIAEGDQVVVEARGETVTKAGLAYNNHYCFIYRLAGGRIEEIVEYCDTALIVSALGQPERAWAANCPQHIPQLVNADEVQKVLRQRDARIAELEAQLRAARSGSASPGAATS